MDTILRNHPPKYTIRPKAQRRFCAGKKKTSTAYVMDFSGRAYRPEIRPGIWGSQHGSRRLDGQRVAHDSMPWPVRGPHEEHAKDPIPSWSPVSFFDHAVHAARPSRMAQEPPKLPVYRENGPGSWAGPGLGLAPSDRASDPAKVFHDSRPGRLMRRPIAADCWTPLPAP